MASKTKNIASHCGGPRNLGEGGVRDGELAAASPSAVLGELHPAVGRRRRRQAPWVRQLGFCIVCWFRALVPTSLALLLSHGASHEPDFIDASQHARHATESRSNLRPSNASNPKPNKAANPAINPQAPEELSNRQPRPTLVPGTSGGSGAFRPARALNQNRPWQC